MDLSSNQVTLRFGRLGKALPHVGSTSSRQARDAASDDVNCVPLAMPVTNSPLLLTTLQLTGPLPEEWSQMTSLHTLDLSSNRLSGQLPDAWSNLKNLTVV